MCISAFRLLAMRVLPPTSTDVAVRAYAESSPGTDSGVLWYQSPQQLVGWTRGMLVRFLLPRFHAPRNQSQNHAFLAQIGRELQLSAFEYAVVMYKYYNCYRMCDTDMGHGPTRGCSSDRWQRCKVCNCQSTSGTIIGCYAMPSTDIGDFLPSSHAVAMRCLVLTFSMSYAFTAKRLVLTQDMLRPEMQYQWDQDFLVDHSDYLVGRLLPKSIWKDHVS